MRGSALRARPHATAAQPSHCAYPNPVSSLAAHRPPAPVASRAACGYTLQAPAWEALRVLRTIDPQHATAVALEAGGAAKV